MFDKARGGIKCPSIGFQSLFTSRRMTSNRHILSIKTNSMTKWCWGWVVVYQQPTRQLKFELCYEIYFTRWLEVCGVTLSKTQRENGNVMTTSNQDIQKSNQPRNPSPVFLLLCREPAEMKLIIFASKLSDKK